MNIPLVPEARCRIFIQTIHIYLWSPRVFKRAPRCNPVSIPIFGSHWSHSTPRPVPHPPWHPHPAHIGRPKSRPNSHDQMSVLASESESDSESDSVPFWCHFHRFWRLKLHPKMKSISHVFLGSNLKQKLKDFDSKLEPS